MTSESSLANPDSDYTRQIQEVLDALSQMQQRPQLVTSPEELEALECEIRRFFGNLRYSRLCSYIIDL